MTRNAEASFTIDTFHFLVDHLQITPESKELQKEFELYQKEHPDNYDLQDMEDFAEEYGTEEGDDEKPRTINTYNGESALSQTLQYTTFNRNDHNFVLLQVHGGCDVRGGYTRPHVFEIDEPYALLGETDFSASVNPDKEWYTDDGGYHWYFNGNIEDPKDEDKKHSSMPENWDIRENGIFYKPNGKPINFRNGIQWWKAIPNLAQKYAPANPDIEERLKA